MQPTDAVRRAIKAAGSQRKLGLLIGCTPQRIWNWTNRGRVPVKFCLKIEAATGVPCEELRPDINWEYMRQKLGGEEVGMIDDYDARLEREIASEQEAMPAFIKAIEKAVDDARPIWHWGDGNGGALIEAFMRVLEQRGAYRRRQ
jgi:DNA-binding transcriptional regulator YdaS (Cro superfamily)